MKLPLLGLGASKSPPEATPAVLPPTTPGLRGRALFCAVARRQMLMVDASTGKWLVERALGGGRRVYDKP